MNIEYELEDDSLELRDVEITIPVPSGSGAPVMNECTGEYEYDKRKGALVWRLPGTTKNFNLNVYISGYFFIRKQEIFIPPGVKGKLSFLETSVYVQPL